MEGWQRDRIESALRGENPTVLTRMRSGFAVIGDSQFLPGYCLLLGVPRVHDLTNLPLPARLDFLCDMSLLGEAVVLVCQPQRINYEIFGNTDPFLHAHVLPRYAWEPTELFSWSGLTLSSGATARAATPVLGGGARTAALASRDSLT